MMTSHALPLPLTRMWSLSFSWLHIPHPPTLDNSLPDTLILIGFQVGHFPLKTLKALIQSLLPFKDTVEKSDAILISDSLCMT